MAQIIGNATITASNSEQFGILQKILKYALNPDEGKWLVGDLEILDGDNEINIINADFSKREIT